MTDKKPRRAFDAAFKLQVVKMIRCEVPCDHIPTRSWPLFRAREVLHGVIESIQREQTT